MKHTPSRFPRLALALAACSLSAAAQAAVISGDPAPTINDDFGTQIEGGVPYRWQVILGSEETGLTSGRVSAWSWDEDNQPSTERGWTHNATWIAVTVLVDTWLSIRVENKGDVPTGGSDPEYYGNNLYPGMTLYTGQDHDGGADHFFNNRGSIVWAEDILYFGHVENSLEHVITQYWYLPAGAYSLVIGGNSPAINAEPSQGYQATFATTNVPEPSTISLLVLAGAALGWRRRRS